MPRKHPATGSHRKAIKPTANRKTPSPKTRPISAENGQGEAAKPVLSADAVRSNDSKERLRKLVKSAVGLYESAMAGTPVTTAQQKMAERVLRAAGLLDEGGLLEVSEVIVIEFVPIEMDPAGIVHTIPAAPLKRPMRNENPVPVGAVANRGL